MMAIAAQHAGLTRYSGSFYSQFYDYSMSATKDLADMAYVATPQ